MHTSQTLECSTSGRILKTIRLGREPKIGECHATDYAFLRLWYKFEVRKFSPFIRFTFRVNGCTRIRQERVYRAKSKYDLMRILSELVFIPQTQESIGCCMTFPIFYFLQRAVVFNIQPDVERLVGVCWEPSFMAVILGQFIPCHLGPPWPLFHQLLYHMLF